jgi:hypothetical protein
MPGCTGGGVRLGLLDLRGRVILQSKSDYLGNYPYAALRPLQAWPALASTAAKWVGIIVQDGNVDRHIDLTGVAPH